MYGVRSKFPNASGTSIQMTAVPCSSHVSLSTNSVDLCGLQFLTVLNVVLYVVELDVWTLS